MFLNCLTQELQLLKLEQNYADHSPMKNPMQEELIGKLEEENKFLLVEIERIKKDQEELLLLLSEQENQIIEFKSRLRALGEEVLGLFIITK